MSRSPVSPRLFGDMTDEVGKKQLSQEDFVDVVKQFYLQFFKNEVEHEIVAIDGAAKTASVRIRLGLTKSKAVLKPLLVWFEEFCDLFPDLQKARYVESEDVSEKFKQEFFPEFLGRVIDWAKKRKLVTLAKTARGARVAFAKFADGS